MRALARVLLDKGWRLSGSDPAVGGDDPLARAGIRCFSGHAAQQVTPDVECARVRNPRDESFSYTRGNTENFRYC